MLNQLKARIKAALAARHAKRRVAELQQSAPHVSRTELAEGLRRLGIAPGDAVFIHSSLKSLGFVDGGPQAVIGALQDAVGPQGTLVLPTYYLPGGTILGTCQMPGYEFDARVHGTNMGALPAAFLATPGVCRSIHPTHSVSAWGRQATWVTEAHHLAPSVFGEGSPWQRFAGLQRAKVLGLGISMGPVTYYHLAEDTLGAKFPVPVWLDETYHLPCRDLAGRAWQVPVRPFVPELLPQRIDHKNRSDLRAYFAAEFEAAGLKTNGTVAQAQAWTIPADGFLQHLLRLAGQGITIYSTPEQLAARPVNQVVRQS